jgi:site-specific DNA-methyltransferase (adenine-specific)
MPVKRRVGKQTVIAGDCLTVLQEMPAASIDVVITSPPYNIGVDYTEHNDRQPREIYLAGLTECFTELYQVLKPSGSFFLNISGHGTQSDLTLPHAIEGCAYAAGFVPQNRIVWSKAIAVDEVIRGHDKPVNSPRFLTRQHELILHLTKASDVLLDKLAIGVPYADKSNLARHNKSQADPTVPKLDLRDRGNNWFIDYDTVQSKAQKFDHPAGFPVTLPTWCIKLHGLRPDLVVLDPYLGAGTTLIAAQALGCHGIGIEIDPQYVETTVQRLQATTVVETAPPHSRIGPSRAALVWHCVGSVRAEDAAGRPPAGEAAGRGTGLHASAEALLRNGKLLPGGIPPEVTLYINEVRRLAAAAGVAPLIEHRLDLSAYHPELFGTLDAAVVDVEHGVLAVADLKSGAHRVPADALQLQLYGGMAFVGLPSADARRIRWIDTVVVQPNGAGEQVRSIRHRVADILHTLAEYVDRAHVATGDKDPPRTAGPWCRRYFCAARNDCPAFHALTVAEAQAEFQPSRST